MMQSRTNPTTTRKRRRDDDGIDWWMVVARAVAGALVGALIGAAIYVFWVQSAWAFLASPAFAAMVVFLGHSAYRLLRWMGALVWW